MGSYLLNPDAAAHNNYVSVGALRCAQLMESFPSAAAGLRSSEEILEKEHKQEKRKWKGNHRPAGTVR